MSCFFSKVWLLSQYCVLVETDVLLWWQRSSMDCSSKNIWCSVTLKKKTINFLLHINKLKTYQNCYKPPLIYQWFPTERVEMSCGKQAMWKFAISSILKHKVWLMLDCVYSLFPKVRDKSYILLHSQFSLWSLLRTCVF